MFTDCCFRYCTRLLGCTASDSHLDSINQPLHILLLRVRGQHFNNPHFHNKQTASVAVAIETIPTNDSSTPYGLTAFDPLAAAVEAADGGADVAAAVAGREENCASICVRDCSISDWCPRKFDNKQRGEATMKDVP